jgi:hypothetical protein
MFDDHPDRDQGVEVPTQRLAAGLSPAGEVGGGGLSDLAQ